MQRSLADDHQAGVRMLLEHRAERVDLELEIVFGLEQTDSEDERRMPRRKSFQMIGNCCAAVRKLRIRVHPSLIRICGPRKVMDGSSDA